MYLDNWYCLVLNCVLVWVRICKTQTFISIFYRDDDREKPPMSFFVVRITSKPPPCLVIWLAFLGGTAGHLRNQVNKAINTYHWVTSNYANVGFISVSQILPLPDCVSALCAIGKGQPFIIRWCTLRQHSHQGGMSHMVCRLKTFGNIWNNLYRSDVSSHWSLMALVMDHTTSVWKISYISRC